jgi:hypothetical protein
MKRLCIILGLISLVIGGCKHPTEVELVDETVTTNLEAFAVAIPDTNIVTASIDSTGVLPDEEVNASAAFLINMVTWDAGAGRRTVAYSRAFFADSVAKLSSSTVGFIGRDVGSVLLDGGLMLKIPHRIAVARPVLGDSVLVRGVEYLSDLTGSYQHDHAYTWTVINRLQPVLTVTEQTPEALAVLAPRGGAIHSRAVNLPISWNGGKGKMTVIISTYDTVKKKARPLLELRVRTNNGRAVIPAKLLSQLPSGTTFLLTFVLANKTTTTVTQPVSGKVLSQAAAVYNVFVELR